MNIRVTVGNNIRTIRLKHGWSQEELADRAGLHRTYISGLERGVRNPTISIISTLASAFDIAPAELLKFIK